MKTAVTNHAVDRYRDRVEGAKGFDRESIRERIRELVDEGFREQAVRDHPTEKDRRVIPFKSGESILFLSIGPNNTTFEASLAVISVLFEHELTEGKKGGLGTIEDIAPELKHVVVKTEWPMYVLMVGPPGTIEQYTFTNPSLMLGFLRKATPAEYAIYRLEAFIP